MSEGTLSPAREQVAAAARRLADAGLVIGTAGNLSVRSGELIAATPTGSDLAKLSATEVTVVDRNGTQLAGRRPPTSELALHLSVYARYDAGAVVHSHAPYATAVASVLDELPVVHYQLLLLGGPVRVVPYATFGTEELAERTLAALEGRSAALLASHGAVSTGAHLEQAVGNMLLLEWGCQLYWRAAALGSPRSLSEQQQAEAIEAFARQATAIGRNAPSPAGQGATA